MSNGQGLKISLGVFVSFFILLVVFICLYCSAKRRHFKKLRRKYFEDNGGLLMQEVLSDYQESKIFTEEALRKATKNYHQSKILIQGVLGTLYKGTLSDKKEVVIYKSKGGATVSINLSQLSQLAHEAEFIASQTSYTSLTILGYCLETAVPLLVYECIYTGSTTTLYEKIHDNSLLSWKLRMKIASDIAEELSDLHNSTEEEDVHGNVKTTNILLDENHKAKLSGHGASGLIPSYQLSTLVVGTLGYLDPEFLRVRELTEKSDVYSFGVVLAELLTSREPFSFDSPEAEINLAEFFVCSVEKGDLAQIVHVEIVYNGIFETVKKVADIAKRCLNLIGEGRPTMKEISLELEGLVADMGEHSGEGNTCEILRGPQETGPTLRASVSNAYVLDV